MHLQCSKIQNLAVNVQEIRLPSTPTLMHAHKLLIQHLTNTHTTSIMHTHALVCMHECGGESSVCVCMSVAADLAAEVEEPVWSLTRALPEPY
jgi:hypothetical protein